ncbi:MAG: flavodoxin [Chloroflexota bacterium]
MRLQFDETDPQLLIVYPQGGYTPEEFAAFFERWSARLERDERFGVLQIVEPRPDDDDEADEDEAMEGRNIDHLIKVVNDFRRKHRQRIGEKTIGYASVEPHSEWLKNMSEAEREQYYLTKLPNRLYMYGTRVRHFTDVESARAWLDEQAQLPPVDFSTGRSTRTEARVGLFYGSTSGTTQQIANAICDVWHKAGMNVLQPVNLMDVNDIRVLEDYDYLILGCPTWNIGELQDDWNMAFPNLELLDLSDKSVALFGAGDQKNYNENFQDALGILGRELRVRGAKLVGFTSTEGYNFDQSISIEDNQFMGLALDEDNQSDMTDQRIKAWVQQLIQEFDLTPTSFD